jgi:hypothetical protein
LKIAPETDTPEFGRKSLSFLNSGNDFRFTGSALQHSCPGMGMDANIQ